MSKGRSDNLSPSLSHGENYPGSLRWSFVCVPVYFGKCIIRVLLKCGVICASSNVSTRLHTFLASKGQAGLIAIESQNVKLPSGDSRHAPNIV